MLTTDKLGCRDNEVVLVPYDPDWPGLFEQEKSRLQSLLRHHIIDIQHFGSTSVPGLTAKPIIDILVALKDFSEIETINSLMIGMGYERNLRFVIEGDYTFGLGNPRQFWVHIVKSDSSNWHQNILFRDRLRSSPELALAYAELKQNLKQNTIGKRLEYTLGKTDFVVNAARK